MVQMNFLHHDIADMSAVDGAVPQGNRADSDGANTNTLGPNQAAGPDDPPLPLDSPFGSSTSSLMSGFPDTTEALMSFWATESALENHLSDLEYTFPCPLQMGPSLDLGLPLLLDLPMLLDLDPEPAANPRQAETLLQASYSTPEITLDLSSFFSSSLCLPVSGDLVGDQPRVAGSAISDSPPTPSSISPSPPASDDIQGGDSPTSLDRLRHTLRRDYPNRKPPGHMFKSFISGRGASLKCTLCAYKIGNREQINQHIMKVHCRHFPFACPFPGCGHRDVRPADMKKHQEKHEDAKWGCEHCGRRVQNERNLRRHIQNKHPEFYQAPRSRRKPRRKPIRK